MLLSGFSGKVADLGINDPACLAQLDAVFAFACQQLTSRVIYLM